MVKAKPQIALVYLIRIYISIHDINRIVMIDHKYMQYCWSSTVKIIFKQRNSFKKLMWFATRSFLIVMSIIDHKVSPQTKKKPHSNNRSILRVGRLLFNGGDESRWMGAYFA